MSDYPFLKKSLRTRSRKKDSMIYLEILCFLYAIFNSFIEDKKKSEELKIELFKTFFALWYHNVKELNLNYRDSFFDLLFALKLKNYINIFKGKSDKIKSPLLNSETIGPLAEYQTQIILEIIEKDNFSTFSPNPELEFEHCKLYLNMTEIYRVKTILLDFYKTDLPRIINHHYQTGKYL